MIALSLAVILRIIYILVRDVFCIIKHLRAGEKQRVNVISIILFVITVAIAVWWSNKLFYHIYRLLP